MSGRVALRRAVDAAPLILLALLLSVFALINPRLVEPAILHVILVQATPTLLLALGAHIVLLTGGIDLSAGVAVAFCSMLVATSLTGGAGLPAAIGLGAGAMAALGLWNGLLIGTLRLPAFVATLATMAIVQGATLMTARKGVLIVMSPTLRAFNLGNSFGVPWTVAATALVAFLLHALLRHTRFGLKTYATGSDGAAAQLAGVVMPRQLLLTYIVASLMTLLTSLMMIARMPIVTPNLGGTSLLLDAIAAAVIGGTSIFGGRGSVGGVVVGALIISLLTNALRVFGVDPSGIDLYKGLMIAAALLVDAGLQFTYRHLDPARV